MVRLDILLGKKAGEHWFARRFPVRIGRDSACDLKIEDDGVWADHAAIHLDRDKGFLLQTQPGVTATVNGETLQSARLRNGDTIVLGAARIRFRLADPRLRNLWLREAFLWAMVAAVAVAQIVLICRVLE
ncbi:MAG TPA: FHA domain-containing protein [Verrucomicrobiota bacterium]|nr:FHA domain-containing protein [Verrucomicrobiota bacterium]